MEQPETEILLSFRTPPSHQYQESLLLDVLLVSRPLHSFGPPSLLFLTDIVLKRKTSDESIPQPGLYNKEPLKQRA